MKYDDDILSDNTQIKRCKECKDCSYWGNGDKFSNAYDKTCCDIYPYPNKKPVEVMDNGKCKYKLVRVTR